MIPQQEGWPTKAKEAPSPHEVGLTPLDTNPVFQCLQVLRCVTSVFITLVFYINFNGLMSGFNIANFPCFN